MMRIMIDLQDLRARPEAYEKAAKDKNLKIDLDAFFALDDKRKELIPAVEDKRAKQNEASKQIPNLKGAEKEELLSEMKILSDDLKKAESALKDIETDWKAMQYTFPSVPLDNVPVGKDDKGNVEVRKEGELPTFDFEPKDHVTLGEALDIIDIPRGAKVSGARNY